MAEIVHSGNDILVDETTSNTAVALNTAPTSTSYGIATRCRPAAEADQAQRVQRSFRADNLPGNITTPALISLTPTTGFAQGTAATSHTVTAGYTFIPEAITCLYRHNTATGNLSFARFDLVCVPTGGTLAATSPLVASILLPADAQAFIVQVGNGVALPLGEGLAIPSGYIFGVAYTTASGVASRSDYAITLSGYEVAL